MSSDIFLSSARKYGCGTQAVVWTIRPEVFGQVVLDSAKSHARALCEVSPRYTHMQALETVSRAAGAESWHQLQKLGRTLLEDRPVNEDGEDSVLPLLRALPMVVKVKREGTPTAPQIRGMHVFAERLSDASGLADEEALDLIASVQGARSWHELVNRRPEDASQPLYSFYLSNDETPAYGSFECSPACNELIERLDGIEARFRNGSPAKRRKALAEVDELLEVRADFLEAYLVKGQLLRDTEQVLEASLAFKTGVEAAEGLIPVGFKGRIQWGNLDNRFYHRLLYCHMKSAIEFDELAQATRLARRQLRLNPMDNMGVRYWLPCLLAARLDATGAAAAARKVRPRGAATSQQSQADLIVALCENDPKVAAAAALRALFHGAFCRHVANCESHKIDLAKGSAQLRGVIPDVETLWYQYGLVAQVQQARAAWVVSIYAQLNVIAAELNLASLFSEARADTGDLRMERLARWDAAVASSVARLAPQCPPMPALTALK